MLNAHTEEVIIFVVICTLLLLVLIAFITVIIYKYQRRQHTYFKDIEDLKSTHKNDLLQSQIEMQEQTFQNISREIHDNIGQKLTLAKLHLNTLDGEKKGHNSEKILCAVQMIGEAINDLSDIGRSMSADLVLQNGLIKALDFEVNQLSKIGLFKISLEVTGQTSFLDPQTELIVFRVAQEAIHNILKHSQATQVNIFLHYTGSFLTMKVEDDGVGFNTHENSYGSGITNMTKRASLVGGSCSITNKDRGTIIILKIPTLVYEQVV